jgi:16S rRNA processing protein RimM
LFRPHLEVGYVSRAHGLAGEVAVRTFDPASEALLQVPRVLLRLKDGSPLELEVESIRDTPRELLVVLSGVKDRTRAEALVGATVCAFREDLEAPAEGEFFQGDLVGLTAVTEQGEELGQVAEVWNTGEVPNLVIRRPGGEELIVPFADDFVPSVDLEKGRLVVRPLEYTE